MMMIVLMLLVCAHVPVHVAVGGEGEVTIFAIEWTFARVHQHMPIQ